MLRNDVTLSRKANTIVKGYADSDEAKDIRKELESLPARIRLNGLAGTLIHLMQKKDKKDRWMVGLSLIDHLVGVSDFPARDELHEKFDEIISEATIAEKTTAAILFASWLKRYAKVYLPREAGDDQADAGADNEQ